MTPHPTLALIEQRVSTNAFDPAHVLASSEIEALTRLATRAPTAYHLQNWRFIAVHSREAKARLLPLAYGQAKISQAAATFIVCGQRPRADDLAQRLAPSVAAGFMPAKVADAWRQAARAQYADPQAARDEAVRSATLGAATLMHAAQAMGLASGPIGGFDAPGVSREFGLAADEMPVLLLAVGRSRPGNWPQKPRRPIGEVLEVR